MKIKYSKSHRWYMLVVAFLVSASCSRLTDSDVQTNEIDQNGVQVVILGIAQDAGYPQMGCEKDCCRPAWENPALAEFPTCLGLLELALGKSWLIEATPEIKWQWQTLKDRKTDPAGIFLTHAHIGHYAGLIELGREVMGSSLLPVFAMPKMANFLRQNGPWSQLVSLENISIQTLRADSTIHLGQLQVTPMLVPHRDEFSETVGFLIAGPEKEILFVPDIDKWTKWDRSLVEILSHVDIALLDGSFYQNGELPNRDMSEIPHPFITETIDLLSSLPPAEKAKVYFIHLNHTNPLLQKGSEAFNQVLAAGMHVAKEGQIFEL